MLCHMTFLKVFPVIWGKIVICGIFERVIYHDSVRFTGHGYAGGMEKYNFLNLTKMLVTC